MLVQDAAATTTAAAAAAVGVCTAHTPTRALSQLALDRVLDRSSRTSYFGTNFIAAKMVNHLSCRHTSAGDEKKLTCLTSALCPLSGHGLG